jgi:serine/threonine-protein kinase
VPDDPSLIGTQVGNYRVLRLIGRGGMGEVYEAEHVRLGKRAAVKVLGLKLAPSSHAAARFFNEARAVAALDHPNIIEIFDYDALPDGRLYMLLELLQGETLSSLLRRERRLEVTTAWPILRSVLAGVGIAHAHGIIHRDLKPGNIFLAQKSAERVVKLLDFGVAKLMLEPGPGPANAALGAPNGGGLTLRGAFLGTPEFAAPEQALGRIERVGPRSDLYSVAVIAFALLTGHPPFEGSTEEVIRLHAEEPPPHIRALRPDLPAALEKVLLRALAKAPEERPATAFELSTELARALGMVETPSAQPVELLTVSGDRSTPTSRPTPRSDEITDPEKPREPDTLIPLAIDPAAHRRQPASRDSAADPAGGRSPLLTMMFVLACLVTALVVLRVVQTVFVYHP